MTPSEWASAANKLSRANPKLSRPQIIDLMKENGMPRHLVLKIKVLTPKVTLGLVTKHVVKDRLPDANNMNNHLLEFPRKI